MKPIRRLIYTILIALSILCMFLPIAQFKDDSVRALNDEIAKKEEAVTTIIASDNGKYTRANKKVLEAEAEYPELFPAQETASDASLKDQLQTMLDTVLANMAAFESEGTMDAKDLEDRKEYMENLKIWQATLDMYNEDESRRETTDARYTQMIVLLRRQLTLDALQAEINAGLAACATDGSPTDEWDAKQEAVDAVQKLQDKVLDTISDVNKKQKDVDELLAQKAELENVESASGISYSLLPGKLPADVQVDMQVVNQNGGVYPTDFSAYYIATWVAVALLLLALALVWAGGSKLVSKVYTFASFANLAGFLVLVYVVLRLQAIPVKLPYSNPVMNWPLVGAMLAMPVVALLLHCTSVTNTKRTMIYVLCICLSILSLLPFWIMIVNATRNSQQIQGSVSLIPSTFLMNNWQILQSKNFDVLIGFKNSAIIAFGSTILSVYFSALTAYGLTVYRFKGAKFLYSVILAIIMIPGQVTGTGFFMFMYQLGWTNSYLPLVIPAIASASTVFFFKQYLEANFQISLVEAARIDGAGEFYTYNKIILPIMVPAMATMGIMAVIGSWNNYLTPLMLLSKSEMKTLPMMVKELRGDIYRTEYGSIYLGLTLTALPLLIVYFSFSKYIIAGVAVGGVKE